MDEGLTYSVHVGKMVNKFEKRMNIITGCKQKYIIYFHEGMIREIFDNGCLGYG